MKVKTLKEQQAMTEQDLQWYKLWERTQMVKMWAHWDRYVKCCIKYNKGYML